VGPYRRTSTLGPNISNREPRDTHPDSVSAFQALDSYLCNQVTMLEVAHSVPGLRFRAAAKLSASLRLWERSAPPTYVSGRLLSVCVEARRTKHSSVPSDKVTVGSLLNGFGSSGSQSGTCPTTLDRRWCRTARTIAAEYLDSSVDQELKTLARSFL
jgi:hypothetical protein